MCGFHTRVASDFNDRFFSERRVQRTSLIDTRKHFTGCIEAFSTSTGGEWVFSGSTYASFGVCLFRSSTKHDNQSGRTQQGSVPIGLKCIIHLGCPGLETESSPTSGKCRPAFVFPQVCLRPLCFLLIKIYFFLRSAT